MSSLAASQRLNSIPCGGTRGFKLKIFVQTSPSNSNQLTAESKQSSPSYSDQQAAESHQDVFVVSLQPYFLSNFLSMKKLFTESCLFQPHKCIHEKFDFEKCDPILTENDVMGAALDINNLDSYTVEDLKRWLKCRGLPTKKFRKNHLIKMYVFKNM